MLADLVVDLLVAEVGLDLETGIAQQFCNFAAVIIGFRRNGGDDNLQRRNPQRHMAGEVLDQDTEETLHRAADGAVDHHRLGLFRVAIDIEGTEAFRQVEIDLRRAALPFTADRVLQRIFEFRTVESALAPAEYRS